MNGEARTRIFNEARAAFAASGYDGASLRTITKAAGVDVALVAYYFGNKDGLFREVVASSCVRGGQIRAALEEARHGAGAEVVGVLGELLGNERCRQVLEAIFRTVLSPDHDEDAMHRQVVEQLRAEYGNVIGGPDSHPGNHIFGALLTGTFVMRHLIPVEPLASVDVDTLTRVLGVQAQEILDAVDDRGEHAGWGELPGGVSGVVVEPGSDVNIGGPTPGEDVTTKVRILDAARRSFARLGYHGTALRDLADEVGCNVALIPYHYGSKRGLFEAVVGQGLARTHEIRALMDERDVQSAESNADAARGTARIIVDMFTKDPSATALRAIVLSAASPRDEHRGMHDDLLRMVQTAYDSAVGRGSSLTSVDAAGSELSEEEQQELRLAYLLFGALPVGVFLLRDIMLLEPLARVPVDDFVDLIAPRLEWLLSGGFTAAMRRSRES